MSYSKHVVPGGWRPILLAAKPEHPQTRKHGILAILDKATSTLWLTPLASWEHSLASFTNSAHCFGTIASDWRILIMSWGSLRTEDQGNLAVGIHRVTCEPNIKVLLHEGTAGPLCRRPYTLFAQYKAGLIYLPAGELNHKQALCLFALTPPHPAHFQTHRRPSINVSWTKREGCRMEAGQCSVYMHRLWSLLGSIPGSAMY